MKQRRPSSADEVSPPPRRNDESKLLDSTSYHRVLRLIITVVKVLLAKINLRSFLLVLVPSFLLPLFVTVPTKPAQASRANRIPLDGLRGLACVAVMNMHWTFAVTDSYDGGSGAKNAQYLFHRPFWNLVWSTKFYLFFIMSGYVLPIRCLKKIHSRAPIYEAIVSSVFRRAIRLFLPSFIMMSIYVVAIRAHLFDKSRANWQTNHPFRNNPVRLFENPPPILPTFGKQLKHLFGAAVNLIDPISPYNLPSFKEYDSHLWTMPVEFYNSIMLYTILLATSRLWAKYRLAIHGFLATFCFLAGHPPQGLFLTGLTIAEIDLLAKKRLENSRSKARSALPTTLEPSLKSSSAEQKPYLTYMKPKNVLLLTCFITGLYLFSLPLVYGESTPGYIFIIANFFPAYMSTGRRCELVRALGALMTVWPVTYSSMTANPRSPSYHILEKAFSNPVTGYLGKISFEVYLVHGFVIRCIGYTILPSLYHIAVPNASRRELFKDVTKVNDQGEIKLDHKGEGRLTAREVGTMWMLGWLVIFPTTIWAADLFLRVVNSRIITLAAWAEETMTQKDSEKTSNSGKLS